MAAILNSVVSAILPTYEYHYFDEQNALQTKTLNIFQKYISRNCLGYYQETHLATVVEKGYELTLQGYNPAGEYTKRTALLSLFEKMPNFRYQVATDQGVTQVQYHVTKDREYYTLDAVTFQVFQRTIDGTEYALPDIKITKKREVSELFVDFDHPIFYTQDTDTPQKVTDGLNVQDVWTLHRLLDKILRESVQTYPGPTYSLIFHTRKVTVEAARNTPKLQSARNQAMQKLGWERMHLKWDGSSTTYYEPAFQQAIVAPEEYEFYRFAISPDITGQELASTAPRTLCLDFAVTAFHGQP